MLGWWGGYRDLALYTHFTLGKHHGICLKKLEKKKKTRRRENNFKSFGPFHLLLHSLNRQAGGPEASLSCASAAPVTHLIPKSLFKSEPLA